MHHENNLITWLVHYENNDFTFDHMICAPQKQSEFSNWDQAQSLGHQCKIMLWSMVLMELTWAFLLTNWNSGLNSSTTLLLSKSQILMHCWVAATSQYLLGLKHKALIMSPASKEYKRFPSAKSHSIATPSLPPLAQREPSGDTVTVFMCPVWPMRLVRSLQSVNFHTFNSLSQPPETMIGVAVAGEKRTQLTQPLCASASWIAYLHSPRVFHSLMVLSREPETICRLSTENATLRTSLVCPTKRLVVAPVLRSQSLRVPSQEPESANWPSEEMTTSWTKCAWPVRRRRAQP